MKKRGRFVLEAALLVPGICVLLVHLVYFMLYAHDYAVLVHGALESGVRGIYQEDLSDRQIERKIQEDLEQKLPERLLWIRQPQIQVRADPVRVVITLSGEGPFLSVGEIRTEQILYRNDPCEILRRSRWLLGKNKFGLYEGEKRWMYITKEI